MLRIPDGFALPTILVAAVAVLTVILLTIRSRVLANRTTSYLGFPLDELTEMARRLDRIDAEHHRARVLGFAIQCSTDQPRLLSVRPLGTAGRHALFGPTQVRVELVLEGPTHVEGVTSMRELAAFLPTGPTRQAPRLTTAIYEGEGVLLVFEPSTPGQPLTLRLAELAVA